eukprot:CAMPEP_0206169858 /NCGR_PEP_ID=MMETSP1474-20131121/37113_1 /ASSEMBLY_ACC=CAM_ASM_001110 /TAXON_ID=97495 /ORGANISM="Imantonia sp., Strain RCC918" /LENGTH=97 /DNA_ID=CAMNT_0053576183 /DNA_START=517 /DNA_END=806 /DNA_ORIENTATION=-
MSTSEARGAARCLALPAMVVVAAVQQPSVSGSSGGGPQQSAVGSMHSPTSSTSGFATKAASQERLGVPFGSGVSPPSPAMAQLSGRPPGGWRRKKER